MFYFFIQCEAIRSCLQAPQTAFRSGAITHDQFLEELETIQEAIDKKQEHGKDLLRHNPDDKKLDVDHLVEEQMRETIELLRTTSQL